MSGLGHAYMREVGGTQGGSGARGGAAHHSNVGGEMGILDEEGVRREASCPYQLEHEPASAQEARQLGLGANA